MLYQLHWQNRSNLKQTEFVAQTSTDEVAPEDIPAHFQEIIERRKDECPEGWVPMVCTEDYEGFVWAARTPAPATEGK